MDTQINTEEKRYRFITDDARTQLLEGLPITERRLNIAGVSTAVLEGGKGTPVILLHGPGEYGAKWLRIIPDLVTRYRVIAPDLPGHGSSKVIDGTFNAEKVLGWLDKLIELTCPGPAVLVGQIIGGAIAARYASRHSHRIRHLVLSDTLGLVPFQPAPDFGEALTRFLTQPTENNHERLWNRCAFDLDAMRSRMGEQWNHIKTYNLDRAAQPDLQAVQQSLMQQYGLAPIPQVELQQISVPTALVWGRHDLATNVQVAETASARYGWPLYVIENAADDPPMEQPEAFLETLYAILATKETIQR